MDLPVVGSEATKRRVVKKSAAKKIGKIRIGDDWNAITIIALSQNNPLKAIAEFVENSIDAQAKEISIIRGRERGKTYLRIIDDGAGIPRNDDGLPDFHYVATHVCDSLKRRLKVQGHKGLQGEFGIGLLSFWTVGEELHMVSAGADGKNYEMRMAKGKPGYTIERKRGLFPIQGVELTISPLLSGIRYLNGEKLQWYLSSELRDRIRQSGVQITITDRVARSTHRVQPKEFSGQFLHEFSRIETLFGPVYLELYLKDQPDGTSEGGESTVGLYRAGTRVLKNLALLEACNKPPWNKNLLQGVVDAAFLNLTPGTRDGIIHDEKLSAFSESLATTEAQLNNLIDEHRRADDEKASQDILRSIQKAFREAFMALPPEEYNWFNIRTLERLPSSDRGSIPPSTSAESSGAIEIDASESGENQKVLPGAKDFFSHPGPLYRVLISPSSCVVPVGQSRSLRAICRDRGKRLVEDNLSFSWEIVDGTGTLEHADREVVSYTAPIEPSLIQLRVHVTQGEVVVSAECLVTVAESLLPLPKGDDNFKQGLPSYSFEKAPGELWRSRYVAEQNLILVNNAHRDFVYATRSKILKIRYLCRLFAKELVYKNFPGYPGDELLERMIELSLYTEEQLRS